MSAPDDDRQVFGPGVPVGMVGIGRPDGDAEGEKRHDGRGHVDDRLERVRRQRDRPGAAVREDLEPEDGEADGEAEAGSGDGN